MKPIDAHSNKKLKKNSSLIKHPEETKDFACKRESPPPTIHATSSSKD